MSLYECDTSKFVTNGMIPIFDFFEGR